MAVMLLTTAAVADAWIMFSFAKGIIFCAPMVARAFAAIGSHAVERILRMWGLSICQILALWVCADLSTNELYHLLEWDRELLLAFFEVALALFASVHRVHRIGCYGSLPMRVRHCWHVCLSDIDAWHPTAPAAALPRLRSQSRQTTALLPLLPAF